MTRTPAIPRNGRRRSLAAALTVALAAVTFTALSTLASPARAAGPRPAFAAPFPCGDQFQVTSQDHAPALDIFRIPNSATEGAQLIASAGGVVTQSYYAPEGAGHIIQISHGNGWYTTYIHLQSRAVAAQDHVSRGTPIGRVGHTGVTSHGVPHLHYEQAIDLNGDGKATWGTRGDPERQVVVFSGSTYGEANGEDVNATSRNCGDNIGVYRPSSQDWLKLGVVMRNDWGNPGDIPLIGDWNGDGVDEPTIYRPSTGDWLKLGATVRANWGEPTDIPIVGDWNGDGIDEPGIYRPSSQDWLKLGVVMRNDWGNPGDIPIVGDWDGNGIDEPGIYRPSSQDWHKLGVVMRNDWGNPGDAPIVGDWNGDGIDEPGIYRPSTGDWLKLGATIRANWGEPTDLPIVGAF